MVRSSTEAGELAVKSLGDALAHVNMTRASMPVARAGALVEGGAKGDEGTMAFCGRFFAAHGGSSGRWGLELGEHQLTHRGS